MLIKDNKEYRNLEEQVLKNKEDVEALILKGDAGLFRSAYVGNNATVNTNVTYSASTIKGITINDQTTYLNYPVISGNGIIGIITTINASFQTTVHWIADIKGSQGLKGDKGDTGSTGLTGSQGVQGIPAWFIDTSSVDDDTNTVQVAGGLNAINAIWATNYTVANCRDMLMFTPVSGNLRKLRAQPTTMTDILYFDFVATLKGPQGNQGIQGLRGEQGIAGTNGRNGSDGVGIQKIEKTATEGLVDTYTIYYTNGGTTTFTVTNGQDGQGGGGGGGDVYTNRNNTFSGINTFLSSTTFNNTVNAMRTLFANELSSVNGSFSSSLSVSGTIDATDTVLEGTLTAPIVDTDMIEPLNGDNVQIDNITSNSIALNNTASPLSIQATNTPSGTVFVENINFSNQSRDFAGSLGFFGTRSIAITSTSTDSTTRLYFTSYVDSNGVPAGGLYLAGNSIVPVKNNTVTIGNATFRLSDAFLNKATFYGTGPSGTLSFINTKITEKDSSYSQPESRIYLSQDSGSVANYLVIQNSSNTNTKGRIHLRPGNSSTLGASVEYNGINRISTSGTFDFCTSSTRADTIYTKNVNSSNRPTYTGTYAKPTGDTQMVVKKDLDSILSRLNALDGQGTNL